MSSESSVAVAVNTVRGRLGAWRWPVHPAWVMLALSALATYMSAPGQSYSVAAFIDPMLDDLGLLRTQYSTAYLVATLVSGMSLPWTGRLVDRYGARVMLPAVATLLALSCLWMRQVVTIPALYLGFCLIRCLGQGALTLISTWMIGEWFEKRRGLATGLVGLGGTLSVMTVPQINNLLIDGFGWRNTWAFCGAAVAVTLVLPGLFLVRNRPEDIGLSPDWGHSDQSASRGASGGAEADESPDARTVDYRQALVASSWTVREACRTSTFWKLLAVSSTSAMVGTGLVFHQVSLLAVHGMSRSQALGLIGLQAGVAMLATLVGGLLTDRVAPRFLMASSMLFLALALALLAWMPSPAWAFLYAGLLGLHGGVIRSTGTVVWVNYYGRLYQGAVRGVSMSVMVIAAAFGPLPLALAADVLGDYRPALLAFLAIPLLAGLSVLTARVPQKTIAES